MHWERDRDYKRTITSLESAKRYLRNLKENDAEAAADVAEWIDLAFSMTHAIHKVVKEAKAVEMRATADAPRYRISDPGP